MRTYAGHQRFPGPAGGELRRRLIIILAMVLGCVIPTHAADDVGVAAILGPGPDAVTVTGREDGTAQPHSTAKPGAYIIKWDKYRTLVVVAYRGQAYHDHEGVLHIDAHRAMIIGVLSDGGWSPDSFDIGTDMMVTTHDDETTHAGNNGEIEKAIMPGEQSEEYQRLLLMAQSIIEGNS